MIESLKFVQGAVAKKDYQPALTHFRIANGSVLGFNGELALSCPIPLDIEASPKALPFVRAIERCEETVTLSMTEGNKLSVRSGKFQAFVECHDDKDSALRGVAPEGEEVGIPSGLMPALKQLFPITSIDASRPWSNGVLFRDQSAYATNNIVLVEYWLGEQFPITINVPRHAVQELIRIGEDPTHMRMCERSVTFFYEGNRWIRSQLYSTSWPDVRSLFINGQFQAIPTGLFEVLDTVEPFLQDDNKVLFSKGRLCTSELNNDGASVELEGFLPDGAMYNAKHLRLLKDVANVIDFTMQPAPFQGDRTRGILLGMRPIWYDSIGFFWQDIPVKRADFVRPMPPIPDTGWLPPTEFPNLSAAKAIAVDTEVKDPELLLHGPGWARGKGHIVGVSVATHDGFRKYFPMRHEVEPEYNLNPDHVTAWLKDTMKDPNQPKIGANITYDVGWMNHEGIEVNGAFLDVQFAEALLNERLSVALDDLGLRYLNEGKTSNILYRWLADFYGGNPTDIQRRNIYRAPPRLVGPYAESDVDLPIRVLNCQWPRLIALGLMNVFRLESELIPLMIAMRFAGVSVDIDQAERVRKMLGKKIEETHETLKTKLGFPVDVWSGDSIAKAFDHAGLSYALTEKGNPTFTAKFLESVDHPVANDIVTIRQHEKIKGTFIESYILESHVNSKIYGQFHQLRSEEVGARSGRFSSSDPNLQNIPIRSKLGKLIRKIYVPDLGHIAWDKEDYSQIEYRFLAHFAIGPGSDVLRQRYVNDPNVDFHELIRILVLELTSQDHDRGSMKTINFGLLYGMGVPKLINSLGLSKSLGKKLFESYHAGAPFIKATFDATSDEATRTGVITTILGRRSQFDLWEPTEYARGKRQPALTWEDTLREYRNPKRAYTHKALNRRLQGSAADLIKVAMVRYWKEGIFNVIGVPRLTVHDELDFSVTDAPGVQEGFAEMRRVLQTAIPLRVPVQVSSSSGPNWGEVA